MAATIVEILKTPICSRVQVIPVRESFIGQYDFLCKKCNTFSQTRLCFIKSKSKNYVEPTVCKLVVVRTTFARNLVADEAENLKVVLEVVVGAKGLY